MQTTSLDAAKIPSEKSISINDLRFSGQILLPENVEYDPAGQ